VVRRIGRIPVQNGVVELRIEHEEIFRQSAVSNKTSTLSRDTRAPVQEIGDVTHTSISNEGVECGRSDNRTRSGIASRRRVYARISPQRCRTRERRTVDDTGTRDIQSIQSFGRTFECRENAVSCEKPALIEGRYSGDLSSFAASSNGGGRYAPMTLHVKLHSEFACQNQRRIEVFVVQKRMRR